MKEINYEFAEKIHMHTDYWFVATGSVKSFADLLNFLIEQKYPISKQAFFHSGCGIVKVPVDKTKGVVHLAGGGLSVWGPYVRHAGLMYEDPYLFQKDCLEQAKL